MGRSVSLIALLMMTRRVCVSTILHLFGAARLAVTRIRTRIHQSAAPGREKEITRHTHTRPTAAGQWGGAIQSPRHHHHHGAVIS